MVLTNGCKHALLCMKMSMTILANVCDTMADVNLILQSLFVFEKNTMYVIKIAALMAFRKPSK